MGYRSGDHISYEHPGILGHLKCPGQYESQQNDKRKNTIKDKLAFDIFPFKLSRHPVALLIVFQSINIAKYLYLYFTIYVILCKESIFCCADCTTRLIKKQHHPVNEWCCSEVIFNFNKIISIIQFII